MAQDALGILFTYLLEIAKLPAKIVGEPIKFLLGGPNSPLVKILEAPAGDAIAQYFTWVGALSLVIVVAGFTVYYSKIRLKGRKRNYIIGTVVLLGLLYMFFLRHSSFLNFLIYLGLMVIAIELAAKYAGKNLKGEKKLERFH